MIKSGCILQYVFKTKFNIKVKLDLKEVENQRYNNLSSLLEALDKLNQVEGKIHLISSFILPAFHFLQTYL